MVSLNRFIKLAGIDLDTLVADPPGRRHYALLKSYQLNVHRGRNFVRRMMFCDLRAHLDMGAHRLTADLLVVLRLFVANKSCQLQRRATGCRAIKRKRPLSPVATCSATGWSWGIHYHLRQQRNSANSMASR
jgi:hypothetical protein